MASDGAANDHFGADLAATDGMLVIGARFDDDKGSGSGSVYVFEKNSTGQYEQVSKLVANDGADSDNFGWTLAATGGMVVVGAWGDDDKGSASGSAYVFEKNSSGQFEQVSKLVASDGDVNDNFGWAVAATDSMVVVGAYQHDANGSNSGSAYVFAKNSTGQYEQVSKLVASDGAADDSFGIALAATDGTILIGSRFDDDKGSASGSVYVFERNSTGQYEQVSKLVASDGATNDYFGYAVAASDHMLVVGAYGDEDKGSESGSVYVFQKNSTGQYEQVSKLVADNGSAGARFGYAVAATNSMVVVGAYGNDDKRDSAGSVFVFE
jgi:hypothetical protein